MEGSLYDAPTLYQQLGGVTQINYICYLFKIHGYLAYSQTKTLHGINPLTNKYRQFVYM